MRYPDKHAFEVLQYVIVPEPDDGKTPIPEPAGPTFVCIRLPGMLTSVDLDDDPAFETAEVGDVGADGYLAAKSDIGDLASAKDLPEFPFRRREVLAQVSGALD